VEIDRRIDMMQRLKDSTISLTYYLSGLSYLVCASVTEAMQSERFGHVKRFSYVGKVTQNVGKVSYALK